MGKLRVDRALGRAAAPVAGLILAMIVATAAVLILDNVRRLPLAIAAGFFAAILFIVTMAVLGRAARRAERVGDEYETPTDMLLRRDDEMPQQSVPLPIEFQPSPRESAEPPTIAELLERLERGLERRAQQSSTDEQSQMTRPARPVDDADGSLRRALDELQRMAAGRVR